MRIFVPYTNLRQETAAAVPDATFVELTDLDYGYAAYFKQRWTEGQTFINVEHDVLPSPEVLDEIWNCPSPICCTQMLLSPDWMHHWHLGCIKIGAQFIADHPIEWDGVIYHNCDGRIWTANGGDEAPVCTHGRVKHLHYEDL